MLALKEDLGFYFSILWQGPQAGFGPHRSEPSFPIHRCSSNTRNEKFDAIVCLGNAFTHLFDDDERRRALREIYGLLNDGGVAVIDHRIYDTMLDKGFSSKHQAYYLGATVDARPESVSEDTVRFTYSYSDGSVHRLTLCPIRQDYLTGLLSSAGFQQVERYGDFEAEYDHYDPDFIIQVATK